MQYDAILVPTDGGDGVDSVLDHALTMADHHGATVHALFVVDRRLAHAARDAREDVESALREEGRDAVGHVEDRAVDDGLAVETAIRAGVPDTVITAYADDQGVDVVVMGTHGRTGRDRLAHLGSVTERVVTDADRPVFVVDIGE